MKKIFTIVAVVLMMSAGVANASLFGGDGDNRAYGGDARQGQAQGQLQGQLQGQAQGQAQGQIGINSSRNRNRNTNTANGGSSTQGQIGLNYSTNKNRSGDVTNKVSNDNSSRSKVRNSGNSDSNSRSNVRNSGNNTMIIGGSGGQRGPRGDNYQEYDDYGYGGSSTLSPTADSNSRSRSRVNDSGNSNVGDLTNTNGSVTGTNTGSMDGNALNSGLVVLGDYIEEGGTRDIAPPVDESVNITDNSVYKAQKRNPVSTAYAAPLVTSNDTCMGSTSAGGQGITLGLSFATTWTDDDCIIRKDARFLHNASHQNIALGLMCAKPKVLNAVAVAGSVAERLACGLNADGSTPAEPEVVEASYNLDD